MATITLHPGEKLIVSLASTDGEFELHFDTPEYPGQLVVRESAGFDGNVVGSALQTLYKEVFTTDFVGDVETSMGRSGTPRELAEEMASFIKPMLENSVPNSEILDAIAKEFPGADNVFSVALAEVIASDFTATSPTVVFNSDRRQAGQYRIYGVPQRSVLPGVGSKDWAVGGNYWLVQDVSTTLYWNDRDQAWKASADEAVQYVDPIDAHKECEKIYLLDGNYLRQLNVVAFDPKE